MAQAGRPDSSSVASKTLSRHSQLQVTTAKADAVRLSRSLTPRHRRRATTRRQILTMTFCSEYSRKLSRKAAGTAGMVALAELSFRAGHDNQIMRNPICQRVSLKRKNFNGKTSAYYGRRRSGCGSELTRDESVTLQRLMAFTPGDFEAYSARRRVSLAALRGCA